MSFIHYTIVGHFDPATLDRSNIIPIRPLDASAIEKLLAEYSAAIREHVDYHDGYAQCCWARDFTWEIGKLVHKFAYKLAERENCVAAELPFCLIEYPESARRIQQEVFSKYAQENDVRPILPLADMSAVALVEAAVEDRQSFKKISEELDSMPPDEEAAQCLISAFCNSRCEPWLTAFLLGCIGHLAGYESAKSILLSSNNRSSSSYAAVAMAKILGVGAYDDLRQVLFGDFPPKVRKGASFGMAATSSPQRLDDFFAAFNKGLLSRTVASWHIKDCNPSDDWLLCLLNSTDAAQQKLACRVIESMVLESSNHRSPGNEVAHCIQQFVDDQAFSINPNRREILTKWVESLGGPAS